MSRQPIVPADPENEKPPFGAFLTRDRGFEIGRIVVVGVITLLCGRSILPIPALWVAIAFGLYPLVKAGLRDVFKKRKISTEIFVTIATTIAMIGGEYVAVDGRFAGTLARAQVGIAMGARGTQADIEAADMALMTDDLSTMVFARALAKRAYRTIQENIYAGVGVVHVLGIAAALLEWVGPIQAAMIHIGPDILVFIHSVKLIRVRINV